MGMLGEADKHLGREWQQTVPGREQMPLCGPSFLPILCVPHHHPCPPNNQCLLSTWEYPATAMRCQDEREMLR